MSRTVKDPVSDFHALANEMRAKNEPFIVATVIEVEGSASAITGSKAIFDQQGHNKLGWVGGGCAERFIGEQAVEALNEGQTRIVLADLDDEIFGLGVACGGRMRVFIDPIVPAEKIRIAQSEEFKQPMQTLASFYGWHLDFDSDLPKPQTHAQVLLELAQGIGNKRQTTMKSLRDLKDLPATFTNPKLKVSKEVTLVGRSRITEALARHFTFLDYRVRNVSSNDVFDFRENEIVVIASHTSRDPQIVERAFEQNAGYVAMVGSRKRALEVIQDRTEISKPLYIPAGLDIRARNPDEIALSIVAEVLTWI